MIRLENIREKLQIAIKQSGLSQSELARRLGLHHSAVNQYLTGRALPALDMFANICAILDLDIYDVLCISEYKDN